MSRASPSNAEAAVLRANASFYRAFSKGDSVAMGELWAEGVPVACIHPGSHALFGRAAVIESWGQILRNAPPFDLRCDSPVVRVFGNAPGGLAIVSCYEGNGERPAHLAATNVFVFEGGSWRMVHHHAGPMASPVPKPADPSRAN
jgi:ketosteroid isomerase-like protein